MKKLIIYSLFLILSLPIAGWASDYHVMMDQMLFGQKIESSDYYASGVATCLAVSIFDQKSGYVYLAHISATVNTDLMVDQALNFFASKGVTAEGLIANIGGGWKNRSEPYFQDLVNSLTAKNISYEQVGHLADVGNSHIEPLSPVIMSEVKDRPSRDFKFDFESGKLIEMTDPEHYKIWN